MRDFIKNIKKVLQGDGEGEKSLNRFMKKKQMLYGVIFGVCIAVLFITVNVLSNHGSQDQEGGVKKVQTTDVDGVITEDFNEKNEESALEQQQSKVSLLQKKVEDMEKRIKESQKNNSGRIEMNEAKVKQIEALYKARSTLTTKQRTSEYSAEANRKHEALLTPTPIPKNKKTSHPFRSTELQVIKFHYQEKGSPEGRKYDPYGLARDRQDDPTASRKKTPKNYVPAGTFARVVLLEGADANASVNAQSDTSGILVRILDNGTLPNGHHSHLKGCFVLASIYGDISSERGEARLTKMSCTRKDQSIFERKVQGYLSFSGKEGIKGTPVMRNGKILAMAGLSGMLSGVGSALQEASQTQTVSPLGSTSVIDSNKIWQNGVFGGASSAMDHLANYYVKRADQYHPVIEIGSGTVATVIFQSGFSLIDGDKEGRKQFKTNKIPDEKKEKSLESEFEVRRLLKQAQKASHNSTQSPFSNVE